MYKDIKVGDFVGKPNFPHGIGIVERIGELSLVVRMLAMPNLDGKERLFAIHKVDFDNHRFSKLDIEDGIIAEDETVAENAIVDEDKPL